MIKKVVMAIVLCMCLGGCTNIFTYIKTDNRSHNTGCNAAGDGGDGVKLGVPCENTTEK
ncbi:hypothetical protein MW364_004632 [Vibrio parahaemolyticus]|nr:hypothetical protein [Vibrio parahaemolyticus]EJL3960767.1 hypothetical protein [Vibrio parahaemolyticus]